MIVQVEEYYTDGIAVDGASREINFHLLSVTSTGEREWHYYGTQAPGESINGVPAIQHRAISLPADFTLLPAEEGADLLYEISLLLAKVGAV